MQGGGTLEALLITRNVWRALHWVFLEAGRAVNRSSVHSPRSVLPDTARSRLPGCSCLPAKTAQLGLSLISGNTNFTLEPVLPVETPDTESPVSVWQQVYHKAGRYCCLQRLSRFCKSHFTVPFFLSALWMAILGLGPAHTPKPALHTLQPRADTTKTLPSLQHHPTPKKKLLLHWRDISKGSHTPNTHAVTNHPPRWEGRDNRGQQAEGEQLSSLGRRCEQLTENLNLATHPCTLIISQKCVISEKLKLFPH